MSSVVWHLESLPRSYVLWTPTQSHESSYFEAQ